MSARPSAFVLTNPGPLRLYSTGELLKLPAPTWLIHGIMPAGGLVGLYGPPGVGKSFVAIDMALGVASGGFWAKHKTQPGYVLYISAEGGTGIGKRVQAWLQARKVESRQASVAWLTEALPIYGDSDAVNRVFQRLSDEVQRQPKLVVIDTLARCFDGNENEQEDMGRFVAGADRFRQEFDATVIVVHHTRLDGERERGNTAFRGAADTMISLKQKTHTDLSHGGMVHLECNKQKDAETFESLEFGLEPVPETGSGVLFYGRKMQKTQQTLALLRILKNRGPLSFEKFLSHSKVSKATFCRHLVRLVESGEIIKENSQYRVVFEDSRG